MVILVCGSRAYTDGYKMDSVIGGLQARGATKIITGGATGADAFASRIAKNRGIALEIFEAEWDKYGKSAGPRRNTAMLNQAPDLVVAFTSDLDSSPGTLDTIKKAIHKGIPVQLYP